MKVWKIVLCFLMVSFLQIAGCTDFKILRIGSAPHISGDIGYEKLRDGSYEAELRKINLAPTTILHVAEAEDNTVTDTCPSWYRYKEFFVKDNIAMPSWFARLIGVPKEQMRQKIQQGMLDLIITDWSTSKFLDISSNGHSSGISRLLKVGGKLILTDTNTVFFQRRNNIVKPTQFVDILTYHKEYIALNFDSTYSTTKEGDFENILGITARFQLKKYLCWSDYAEEGDSTNIELETLLYKLGHGEEAVSKKSTNGILVITRKP
ncbi:MAG: hypothetical protein LBB29_03510 [Holosporaceae bacterium]|jgi:hypothetical protein|nr:hypothetical protein [Holosporaceae bacterium]